MIWIINLILELHGKLLRHYIIAVFVIYLLYFWTHWHFGLSFELINNFGSGIILIKLIVQSPYITLLKLATFLFTIFLEFFSDPFNN